MVEYITRKVRSKLARPGINKLDMGLQIENFIDARRIDLDRVVFNNSGCCHRFLFSSISRPYPTLIELHYSVRVELTYPVKLEFSSPASSLGQVFDTGRSTWNRYGCNSSHTSGCPG